MVQKSCQFSHRSFPFQLDCWDWSNMLSFSSEIYYVCCTFEGHISFKKQYWNSKGIVGTLKSKGLKRQIIIKQCLSFCVYVFTLFQFLSTFLANVAAKNAFVDQNFWRRSVLKEAQNLVSCNGSFALMNTNKDYPAVVQSPNFPDNYPTDIW